LLAGLSNNLVKSCTRILPVKSWSIKREKRREKRGNWKREERREETGIEKRENLKPKFSYLLPITFYLLPSFYGFAALTPILI
jgi:hypothetical protein